MDLEVRKPVNCNVFAQWLVHYQTDELPEDDRAALQEHLDGCSGCHRRLQIEDRFLEVLRDAGFVDAIGVTGDVEKTHKGGFRLDYVFTKGFEIVDGGVVRGLDASDHDALWVDLALTK